VRRSQSPQVFAQWSRIGIGVSKSRHSIKDTVGVTHRQQVLDARPTLLVKQRRELHGDHQLATQPSRVASLARGTPAQVANQNLRCNAPAAEVSLLRLTAVVFSDLFAPRVTHSKLAGASEAGRRMSLLIPPRVALHAAAAQAACWFPATGPLLRCQGGRCHTRSLRGTSVGVGRSLVQAESWSVCAHVDARTPREGCRGCECKNLDM
jgi:hypothetical protein